MVIESVTLEGNFVRLEPLSKEHREGLCRAILDGELWKLLVASVPHPDNVDEFLNDAHNLYKSGVGLAFAVVDKLSLIHI